MFDRFGAPKGAAVHIAAFARALGEAFGPVDLVTVASDEAGVVVPPGVIHHPLALHKAHVCDKLVFEVNGLPSIELKYHYPGVADDRELLGKLIAQEDVCLQAADLVLTVSPTNAEYLVSRGVPAGRIRVIPNGVDLSVFGYVAPGVAVLAGNGEVSEYRQHGRDAHATRVWRPCAFPGETDVPPPAAVSGASPVRLLYSGTMAAWQGVYRAIESLELLRKDVPATLTLLGPMTPGRREEILETCGELGVAEHVAILDAGDQAVVARVHHEHHVALAPLLRNDRNLVQGCCPLKVLEAMASGTPLVASDMPVVSVLAGNEREALLVKAGSAKAIKDAVLRLLAERELAVRLSEAARRRAEAEFTWEIAGRRLVEAYEEVLGVRAITCERVSRSMACSAAGEKAATICSLAERPRDERTPAG